MELGVSASAAGQPGVEAAVERMDVPAERMDVPADRAPSFEITTYYERYLPVDGTLVDVIATVRATRAEDPVAGAPAAGRLAEVIMLDCSGSMGAPASKLFQARRAAIAAIDALADGVLFAIVAGTHEARMIYPDREELVEMNPRRREAARRQLQRIGASGGTSMSHWLRPYARAR